MFSLPDDRPDDPVLLKQLLLEVLARQAKTAEVLQAHEGHIVDLKEQIKLLRDRLLASPVIHCDEIRVQVLKEPDRDPTSQPWM